jgi:hypothetical protein
VRTSTGTSFALRSSRKGVTAILAQGRTAAYVIYRRSRRQLYLAEEVNELPNKSPYAQYVYNGYLSKWITPKWQGYNLYEIHSVEVERWLGTLKSLANGSRAKLHNIMSAIYSHAIRWEFFDRNPIASVRQTAKRRCEPEVLTIDELKALLSELESIYRTMVYTAGVTGCRMSEVAGPALAGLLLRGWRNSASSRLGAYSRNRDEDRSRQEAGTTGIRPC